MDELTICVSRAERLPHYQNAFKLVHNAAAEYFFAVAALIFIITVLLGYYVTYREGINFDLWQIVLKTITVIFYSATKVPVRRASSRFVFAICLIGAFFIYTLAMGIYIETLGMSFYHHQVATIGEVIDDDDYRLVSVVEVAAELQHFKMVRVKGNARLVTLILHFHSIQLPTSMTDNMQTCSTTIECLSWLVGNPWLAVAVSRQYALNNRHVPRWKIHCFSERNRIYGYPVTMVISNELAPVAGDFDSIVRGLTEGGFLAKWAGDSRVHNHPMLQRNYVLEMKHVVLPIILFSVLSLLSFVALALELIVHWQLCGRPRSVFWRMTERLVDGKRYLLLPVKQKAPAIELGTMSTPGDGKSSARATSKRLRMIKV